MGLREIKKLTKDLTDDQKVKLAADLLSDVEPTKTNLGAFLNRLNESTFGELDGWFDEKS